MLRVRDLRVVFPNGHAALKRARLDVERGEFVCVIDRRGAGKSTLLRCLNGLIAPGAGPVYRNEST